MFRAIARDATARITGARAICQFNCSNPILKHNAENRGFKSFVWVEEGDSWWFDKLNTQVRQGELPTECPAPSRIELFNLSQVLNAPDAGTNPMGHHSFKTKKRYSGGFAKTLEEFATAHRLDSKWWLSPAEIRRLGLRTELNARPCVQVISRPAKFFNADQFTDPLQIQLQPFSGGTGRAFDAAIGDVLFEHAQSIKANSAVYFTPRQAAALGLALPIGVLPADVPSRDDRQAELFAVDDIVDAERFLKSLQRFPVKEHTYVISGQTLTGDLLEAAKKSSNKSMYWVSKYELESRQGKLRQGAKAIRPPPSGQTWAAYNAEQFDNVDAALQAVGKFIPTD